MFYPIFKILKLKVLGWQVDDEEQRLHIDNGSDEMEKRDGRNGSHGCLKKMNMWCRERKVVEKKKVSRVLEGGDRCEEYGE